MYQDLHYVASAEDQEAFRLELERMGLHILPERPDGPSGGALPPVDEVRRRLLSLRPINRVVVSYTDPYPHYSPAAQPLIQWRLPQIRGKVMITGHLRHHRYMVAEGEEFAEIAKAFSRIEAWFKAHWQSINQFDFIGPVAARLVNEEGYSWAAFDPANTTIEAVRADGTTKW